MLEYVFYRDQPRKRFQRFLAQQGLLWTLEPAEMETLVVVDDAGVDGELAERIETVYDELFAIEQAAYAADNPRFARSLDGSGVPVRLKDGRAVYADLPPELLSRILTIVSPMELDALVSAIVRAVEEPQDHIPCTGALVGAGVPAVVAASSP